jgi:hypothetical protein
MNKLNIFLALLLLLAGCRGNKQTGNDDLITVDVTKSYPKKELILQDFMDVEYIPLETNREFVTMGWLHYIGKDVIIVRNRLRNTDGNIFVFDRNGKAIRIINRYGKGPEEYEFLLSVVLDEDKNELFVNDRNTRKIFVYDMIGNFKREFRHKEGHFYNIEMYNFDRDNLIFQGDPCFIVSKHDGSITREVQLPYKEKVDDMVRSERVVMPIRNRRLVPHRENSWLIMDTSSDTVYRFMPDYSMIPLLVRTPSVQSMSPPTFLFPAVFSDRYWFMQTVENKWDWETNTGHTRINLMYDRKEHAIFECVVYNGDIADKQPILMTSELTFGNHEIAFVQKLEADDLYDLHKEGKLKGKLKEVAAGLKEEDNPVIMLVKHKK